MFTPPLPLQLPSQPLRDPDRHAVHDQRCVRPAPAASVHRDGWTPQRRSVLGRARTRRTQTHGFADRFCDCAPNMHWLVSSYNRSMWAFSSSPWLASCCPAISSFTVETWSGKKHNAIGWLPCGQTKITRPCTNQIVDLPKTEPMVIQSMDTHHTNKLPRWTEEVKLSIYIAVFCLIIVE